MGSWVPCATCSNVSPMCRRFLADEADFAKENIDRCEITVSYENIDLDSCYKDICDRILQ